MKPVMLNIPASTCSLILLFMAQCALASGEEGVFHYDVELQAPAELRKPIEEYIDLYRWRDSERMNEAQLQRLVRLAPEQIREVLSTDGYYSPRVEAEMVLRGGRWLVNITVAPGEPVRVTSIDLQVTGPFNNDSPENQARLDKMRADWDLLPGMVFRHEDWESAKRNALKALLLDGYPAASITHSRAAVDRAARSADLQIVLESGPLFTFGEMEITGLQRYSASVVELLSSIVPGEPYSQNKLLELQSGLQSSPYFLGATVNVDTNPEQPYRVPVRVEVTENQSRKLGFGIGISTDTGPRGMVEYRDVNVFGRAWQLGGIVKIDQKRQSASSDLVLPVTAKRYRDSINVLFERADIEGEVTQKTVFGPKRTIARGKTETAYGVRYFIETQEIKGGPISRRYTLSPSYSWILRDVDSLLFPASGYMLNIAFDVAARALRSDQDFIRSYIRGAYFITLGESGQMTLHSELGAVMAESRTGIPSDFLFRTGGDQTVRGYAYQSLGVPQGDAIVGGRYLAVASAEYVHWFTEQWGAAVFFDAGNAADTTEDLVPVYGYGAGARWRTPVAPLNFDIAYGREAREMRIHFSMGFNF